MAINRVCQIPVTAKQRKIKLPESGQTVDAFEGKRATARNIVPADQQLSTLLQRNMGRSEGLLAGILFVEPPTEHAVAEDQVSDPAGCEWR